MWEIQVPGIINSNQEAPLKHLAFFLALLITSLPAFAGEKVKGSNFLVVDQQTWPTGDGTGYWMYRSEGIGQTTGGPIETAPVECNGAGYWDQGGSWGEGICVHGVGEDVFVDAWQREKGKQAGTWKLLSGKGKYAGITGEGTYVVTTLPGDRNVSVWEGEMTLAK
jgi:hypothetical protein